MLDTLIIVSGGQTGADRAALEFAIQHGIQHGGWCPRGRRAEDGPLAPRYQLRETPSRQYTQRTNWNVRDSDATLALTISPVLRGGTALTLRIASRLGKPWLHLARQQSDVTPIQHVANCAARLWEFCHQHQVQRLNVAGPRASQEPEVVPFVCGVLGEFVRRSRDGSTGP